MRFLGLLVTLALFLVASSKFALSQTTLVNHSDIWRSHKGTNAPQAGWNTVADASLNAEWGSGPGGFGYGDGDDATTLTDMQNRYVTVYVRRTFNVASPIDSNLLLRLTVDYDDAYVAYLDGAEIARSANIVNGVVSVEPAFTNRASSTHEASAGAGGSPPVTTDLGSASTRLAPGDHVLALIGLNESAGSSDFSIIPDLLLVNPGACPANTICTDTNWIAANSPYTITSSLTITAGATLTIEPGVTVRLGGGVDLMIANGGRLLAEGTAQAPILFTRSGASGSWGNLTINGAVGSPETRIAYAHFEFNGGSPCLEVAAGTVFFDHLTFGNTAASYIHVDGASFVIQDCYFPTASAGFELVHGVSGIKSGGHGIFMRNFFGAATGYNDVVDFTGGNRPGPVVHFINNVFTGSGDDLLDLDSTDAWIEGNIFLHAHKNGSPDTASAISGGADNADTSQITIIGNLVYDCDQAAMAKQGNFYTLINNTIVHQSHQGGLDTDGAVVALADEGTTEAVGMYLEGNIVYDAEKLVRNQTASIVTFTNNLMPFIWSGPGSGNSTNDPMLNHIPQLSETFFTNWAQAQIMRTWFGLLPGSPALGTGPNGRDMGGVIPLGASISGEPNGITPETNATLVVGIVRTGSGIPSAGWPNGSGFTHYKWRLDTNAWSAETPIATPIALTGLAGGPHYVEVSGKRDSGLYQDDPRFGVTATVTRSRTWTVGGELRIDDISISVGVAEIKFTGLAGQGYTIYRRDSLSTGSWEAFGHLDPTPVTQTLTFTDTPPPGTPMRFYRLSSP